MILSRDDAKEYVKLQLPYYLAAKGINTRKPFRCLNPMHNDKNPSMSMYIAGDGYPHCKCHGCGVHYDAFDLIGIDYGLSDDKSIFEKAYNYYGLEINDKPAAVAPVQQKKIGQKCEDDMNDNTESKKEDMTAFFLKAHEEAAKTDYFHARGLSDATIERYKLGYVENFCINTGGKIWKAAIIPTTKSTYTARNTAADADQKDRIRKVGGANPLFNAIAIKGSRPVFVVEGEFDALSIAEAGGEAVALGSTGNYRAFTEILKKADVKTPLIILALDNDDAGDKCSENIMRDLQGFGKCSILNCRDLYGAYKDANEMLVNDRAALVDAVKGASLILEAERQQAIEKYSKNSAQNYIDGFIDEMRKPENTRFYPTGFYNLDNMLDGGLYKGLYCVGAISSLGKTTFCLQIADEIAKSGEDVLIFSLEMARNELMAKSISRNTYFESLNTDGSSRLAKTTRAIMSGNRYDAYTDQEMQVINNAIEYYKKYASHVYIHEGVGDIGVQEVRDTVKTHIEVTGKAPVVIIDYIQILAPYNESATDKQNTDKAVLELKRISRDFSIPVIGISSFNRDNYNAPVSMASFKESGAVEYSSDVLIGLQYYGMDWQDGESEKDRNKRIRALMSDIIEKGRNGKPQKVQVKVLKNRNGSKFDCCLDFIPKFNYFYEPYEDGYVRTSTDEDGFSKYVYDKNSIRYDKGI